MIFFGGEETLMRFNAIKIRNSEEFASERSPCRRNFIYSRWNLRFSRGCVNWRRERGSTRARFYFRLSTASPPRHDPCDPRDFLRESQHEIYFVASKRRPGLAIYLNRATVKLRVARAFLFNRAGSASAIRPNTKRCTTAPRPPRGDAVLRGARLHAVLGPLSRLSTRD